MTTPIKKITTHSLRQMKQRGEKIACLTVYDASMARVLDAVGVEVMLVGDSLGMVVQGHDSTLPVSLADMIYHSACVRRGSARALIVADLPYMSYATPAQTLGNAARLQAEGGAGMVKLEGGAWLCDSVRLLSERGIAVCAHLGLLPQSVHQLGGYRVQGRQPAEAGNIKAAARDLVAAGASLLVLECVPRRLAAEISATLPVPVIGIGAGKNCDGQVLVLNDVLGIGPLPKHARQFLIPASGSISAALGAYVAAVKSGEFPADEHGFD